jgi:hypothetical protein
MLLAVAIGLEVTWLKMILLEKLHANLYYFSSFFVMETVII